MDTGPILLVRFLLLVAAGFGLLAGTFRFRVLANRRRAKEATETARRARRIYVEMG